MHSYRKAKKAHCHLGYFNAPESTPVWDISASARPGSEALAIGTGAKPF